MFKSDLFRVAKAIKRVAFGAIKLMKYRFGCLLCGELVEDDFEGSYKVLWQNVPRPESTCIGENTIIVPPKYDIQIIVPTYNNEKYLKECVDSILNQITEYSYKLVIVDDGSTDNSSEILKAYDEYENVEIIKSENGGIASARNLGLKAIDSTYITFVDSDDMLPPNAINALLDCAYRNDADIVEGSHYRLFNNSLVKYNSLSSGQVRDVSKLMGMPWAKVYKSSLWDNVVYPKSLWYEDTICFMILFAKAKKIFTISDYVYSYRVLANSASHSTTKRIRSIDTIWITELLLREYSYFGLEKDEEFHDKVMRQIITNERRLRDLSIEVQKAAFVITANMLKKYCIEGRINRKYNDLVNYIKCLDFGRYKLFCETR